MHERINHPPEAILPATEECLRAIPGLSYPQALAERFPRILNQLVASQGDPVKLKACFNELTHDVRGQRHGFPFDVLMNIQELQEFMLGEREGFQLTDENKWVS